MEKRHKTKTKKRDKNVSNIRPTEIIFYITLYKTENMNFFGICFSTTKMGWNFFFQVEDVIIELHDNLKKISNYSLSKRHARIHDLYVFKEEVILF